MVINILMIPSILVDISALNEAAITGADPMARELSGNDVLLGLLGLMAVPALIVSAVFFCMWMHRAYRVLEVNNVPDLEHTPGKAAGYWFVPIFNLYYPYRIMKEIHEKSGHRSAAAFVGTESIPGWMIGAWWTLWIVSGTLSQLAWRISGDTAESMITTGWLDIGALAVEFVAGVFVIKIVSDIQRRQGAAFTHRPPQPSPTPTPTPQATNRS